jgi:hypothetical protein
MTEADGWYRREDGLWCLKPGYKLVPKPLEMTEDIMKIRYGFVSNSSSSSFLLYGDYFEADWRNTDASYKEFFKSLSLGPCNLSTKDEDGDEKEDWQLMEELSKILEEKGYDTLVSECGVYYGVIVYPEGETDIVCKELQEAKLRAKKLKLKDNIELIYTSC